MKTSCDCKMCQRSIRLMIERLYQRRPRWMGLDTVRARAGLGWIDYSLYLLVFGRMVALGQLLKSNAPDDEFPTYLSARCMVPAQVLAEAAEGRRP